MELNIYFIFLIFVFFFIKEKWQTWYSKFKYLFSISDSIASNIILLDSYSNTPVFSHCEYKN